jgi:hypothetical protein
MAGIGPRQEDPSVSRISRTRESTHVALKVEGGFVADWIPDPLAERKGVELDFEDVSFVDREAAAAVRELIARGVTILRPTPLVRHLLDRQDPL